MILTQPLNGVGHDRGQMDGAFLEKHLQERFNSHGKTSHQMHRAVPFRITIVGSMPIQWLQYFEIPETYRIHNHVTAIVLFLVLRGKNRQRGEEAVGVGLVIDGINELSI